MSSSLLCAIKKPRQPLGRENAANRSPEGVCRMFVPRGSAVSFTFSRVLVKVVFLDCQRYRVGAFPTNVDMAVRVVFVQPAVNDAKGESDVSALAPAEVALFFKHRLSPIKKPR